MTRSHPADFRVCTERGDRIRRVVGIVRHVEEGELAEYRLPRAVIVPALWMLGLRRNTRIFQEKTTVEILEDVLGAGLGPYSRSIQNELAESYPRREYCVQYQETDLEFVHRLMEEEGIHYAFDHEGEQEVLVLRDANEQHPEIPDREARRVPASQLRPSPTRSLWWCSTVG